MQCHGAEPALRCIAGDSDTVAVLEVSRAQTSPLALLRGGASASGATALALSMVQARGAVKCPCAAPQGHLVLSGWHSAGKL